MRDISTTIWREVTNHHTIQFCKLFSHHSWMLSQGVYWNKRGKEKNKKQTFFREIKQNLGLCSRKRYFLVKQQKVIVSSLQPILKPDQVYLDSLMDKVSSLLMSCKLWDSMTHICNSGINSNQSITFWIMSIYLFQKLILKDEKYQRTLLKLLKIKQPTKILKLTY